jgi:hypothetical protein
VAPETLRRPLLPISRITRSASAMCQRYRANRSGAVDIPGRAR